jgi:hypothetical protein
MGRAWERVTDGSGDSADCGDSAKSGGGGTDSLRLPGVGEIGSGEMGGKVRK